MLPTLYAEDPKFYENMRIQEISERLYQYMKEANLLNFMYHAFNVLPEQQLNPHGAFQKLLKR